MAARARFFFIWRPLGKIVAIQLLPLCDDKIYDECFGLDDSVSLDLHCIFTTLPCIISWALAAGFEVYTATPQLRAETAFGLRSLPPICTHAQVGCSHRSFAFH